LKANHHHDNFGDEGIQESQQKDSAMFSTSAIQLKLRISAK